jgi:hypothetical protein
MLHLSDVFRRSVGILAVASASLLALTPPAEARVKKIVVERKVSPAFDGMTFGAAGQYETLAGRAYGELDPNDPRNAIITDIKLAPRNAAGKVEYVTSFYVVKPVDMSKSSRLMWHGAPNRGGRLTIVPAERAFGDLGLSSGWQGDNSGNTVPGENNEWVTVPIAKNPDGSAITGLVIGRIVNATGAASRPMIVNANPVPYKPVTLDTTKATLMTHTGESMEGVISGAAPVPPTDWAFAKCTDEAPFPGTPDPTQICVKGGFDPKLLYEVVFTSADNYVLGIGFAAFRDVASFLRYEKQDDEGTPNPLAGQVSWVISRGQSQAGNFLRALIHLGFTQDEASRKVYDGAWPIVAGRRTSVNTRFALPDGALKLYEAGAEGPQWWTPSADPVRGLPAKSLLDRCTASKTCPKVIEHFGAAEAWALNLSPGLVGTTVEKDIPLPANVRRYYIPSTPHGGGAGGFTVAPGKVPNCPGPSFGVGMFANNPVPHAETINALRYHFRNWVMKDVAPPPSKYPTLAGGFLVDPTKAATGFPTIPGVPANAPTGLISPLLDYDWGPEFNYADGSGVRSKVPPTVKRVIKMKVPRVDADGNELGGVPVVLRDAPLGTYMGWNIVAAGFHKEKLCNYAGGMIPFATTKAEREAKGDPRLSLEERYKDHAGYVDAVRKAAARAVSEGFLLQADADALIKQAEASDVLNPNAVQPAPEGGRGRGRGAGTNNN